jgi:hypothetical protein
VSSVYCPENLKLKTHTTIMLPVVSHGLKIWSMSNNVRMIKLAGHAAHMGEIKACTKSEELTKRDLFEVRA